MARADTLRCLHPTIVGIAGPEHIRDYHSPFAPEGPPPHGY
jgi:hypothetical protein